MDAMAEKGIVMKMLLVVVLVLALTTLLAGCNQSGSDTLVPKVYEFHLEVLLETNDSGDLKTSNDGAYNGTCHLQSRVINDQKVSHPVLESRPLKFNPAQRQICQFEYTLPFGFCAMTSSGNAINCKVSKDRESGWFVESSFDNPRSGHLLCTIACFDRQDR